MDASIKGVLKYRFYYYVGVARPRGPQVAAIAKSVCDPHRAQEKGACHPVGHTERCSGGGGRGCRGAGVQGARGQEPSLQLPRKERGGAWSGGSGLASVNAFSRLGRDRSRLPRLVPGPGRPGTWTGPGARAPQRRWGVRALDWRVCPGKVSAQVGSPLGSGGPGSGNHMPPGSL